VDRQGQWEVKKKGKWSGAVFRKGHTEVRKEWYMFMSSGSAWILGMVEWLVVRNWG